MSPNVKTGGSRLVRKVQCRFRYFLPTVRTWLVFCTLWGPYAAYMVSFDPSVNDIRHYHDFFNQGFRLWPVVLLVGAVLSAAALVRSSVGLFRMSALVFVVFHINIGLSVLSGWIEYGGTGALGWVTWIFPGVIGLTLLGIDVRMSRWSSSQDDR